MLIRIKQGILAGALIMMILLVLEGCSKTAPTPTEPTPDSVATINSTYVGDDTCKACHEGISTAYHATKHANGFKPLSAYSTANPLGKITVYDAVNKDKPTSAQLDLSKEGNVYGVMMDEYVVAAVPGFKEKIYRVAKVHKVGEKWEIQPAKEVVGADQKPIDSDKDGKTDWSAESYTCGKCHSPGIEVGSKTLAVSCESCHGPAGAHISAAQDKKKGSIKIPNSENCLTCHQSDPTKDPTTGVITANNHYGTRDYSVSNHAASGQLNGCLACHGPHKANASGALLIKDNAAEICMSCHADKKYDPSTLMWKNPTDERGHITADHSFGAIKYEDTGDDPKTKPIEITNPKSVELLKKAIPDLAK
ncbi:MAG TPA: cytochrome c3 family protein [Desulfosporosinus sp.]|nr:cytochrome c3 family protein [Desulfosporosinus sp.]